MPELYSGVSWTVADLLSDVRREARIPDAEYSDTEILREANNAIWTDVATALVVDQGVSAWGLDYDDFPVSGALGGDSDEFVLPAFSSAEGISHVQWFTSSTATSPSRIHPIGAQVWDDYKYESSNGTGNPQFYAIEAGRIRLVRRPSAAGIVRVWYQSRHPELVATSNNVATLASIDTSADTITLDAVASGWGGTPTSAVPIRVDLYSAYGPHRYFYRGLTLIDSTEGPSPISYDYVGADEDEDSLADIPAATNSVRVALHGQCDFVQLPLEYRKALSQKTASYILRQVGDEAGANSMEGMATRSIAAADNRFMPRTRGQAQRFINRRSPLRSGARRSNWRG